MTEERAPYDAPEPERAPPHLRQGLCPSCRQADDAERRMWLMIRRALLLAVRAIETRHGKDDGTNQRAA